MMLVRNCLRRMNPISFILYVVLAIPLVPLTRSKRLSRLEYMWTQECVLRPDHGSWEGRTALTAPILETQNRAFNALSRIYSWLSTTLAQPTDALLLEDPVRFRDYVRAQWKRIGSADAKFFGTNSSQFLGSTLDYTSRQPISSMLSIYGDARYTGIGDGLAVTYQYNDLPVVDEFRQYKGHEDIWMYRCRTTIADSYFYGWLWFVGDQE